MRWRPPASLVSALASVFVLVVVSSSAPARAEDPEPPSAAILAAGLAVAAGGGALSYYAVHKYDDASGTGFGWLTLNTLGSVTMQAGGALETYWAWRHGERRLALDLKAGVPLRSRRGLAVTGLALGGVALVGMYVGAMVVFAKNFSCTSDNNDPDDIRHCANDTLTAVTIVNLIGGAVVLVAAPMVGYGFAYESAAQRAGHKLSINRVHLLPSLFPGGAGAQLVARF